jgi:hypothetical protein
MRLQADLPCIDAADNTQVPPEVLTDLVGAARFVDVATAPDVGVPGGAGWPAIADMGAWELQGRCVGDFNDDGGVDGQDVEAFFIAWQEGDPRGDVNQDGGVDGADVEAFFVAWEAGC